MTSNFLQLSSPWSDLQSNLKDVICSATVLLTEQIESAEEFQEYLTRYTAWDQEAMNLLKESFTETNNQLVIEFSQVMDNAFHIQGKVPNFHTQASNLKKRIENKIAYLLYNERILNVCDAIVRPESIDLEKRASLNFKQKQSLILEKLYELYDDSMYPISEILTGNGVKPKRYTEPSELLESLENAGLVECYNAIGMNGSAKLTINGAILVEQSREPVREDYNDIPFSHQEMSQKIEELKSELNKVGLGNEILFDELQEIKELYKTLNKKNWAQLLKGKLVDIAIGKLVENDTISFIYEHLTNHTLKLH
jgi:hypothetical protein